jgi:uncharacterized protein YcfJ
MILPPITGQSGGLEAVKPLAASPSKAPLPQPMKPADTAGSEPAPLYGINHLYGQMSPGGILPDGRRMRELTIERTQDRLDKLADIIECVTKDIQEARETGDYRKENSLSGTLERLQSAQVSAQSQLKGLQREEEAQRFREDPGKQIGAYVSAHLASQVAQSTVNAVQTIMGSQKMLAGGNYAEAVVQKQKGFGELIGSGAGTAIGAALGSLIPGGTFIGAGIGGMLGHLAGGLAGNISERDLAFSKQYEKSLPAMESFYQRYGANINRKTGEENSQAALDFYYKIHGAGNGLVHFRKAVRPLLPRPQGGVPGEF